MQLPQPLHVVHRATSSALSTAGELERNQRFALGSLGLLGAGEIGVAAASPLAGGFLIACTSAAVFFGRRARPSKRASSHPDAEGAGEAAPGCESGLPDRPQLIEALARETARAQRYATDLTLVVVEVSRMGELQSLWGEATSERAVAHVAETLRRVTRTSDLVSRLDRDRFAVLLVHCTREQASLFINRLELAVSNRPLPARESGRMPLYVSVDCSALQFDAARFRGPLDFLSAAGGDVAVPAPVSPIRGGLSHEKPQRTARPVDGHALRRQLIRDYYPDGKAKDFAAAYTELRGAARKAG